MSINRIYFTLLTSFHSFVQSSSLLLSSQAEIFTLRHSNTSIGKRQSILFTPRIDPLSSIIFSCEVQTSPSIGRERNQPRFVPVDTYITHVYIHFHAQQTSLSLSLRIFEEKCDKEKKTTIVRITFARDATRQGNSQGARWGTCRFSHKILFPLLPLPLLIELSSKSRRRCRRCRTDRLLRFRGGYTTALSHRLQLRVIGKLPCPHPSAALASPSPHERLTEGGGEGLPTSRSPRFETTEAVLAGRYDTNSTFAVVDACMHYRVSWHLHAIRLL